MATQLSPGELQTLKLAGLDQIFGSEYGIPVSTLLGQQYVESRGNPLATNSGTVTLPNGQTVQTDAQGVAQFEPATFAAEGTGSPYVPSNAVQAEAHYLHQLEGQTGSLTGALNAYSGNAYPGYAAEVQKIGAELVSHVPISGTSGTASALNQAASGQNIAGITPTVSGGFFGWLHRYAWVLILPGGMLIWLGIKKIVG